MNTENIYLQKDDDIYIKVEFTEVAREILGMKLLIGIAEEKIAALRKAQESHDSIEEGLDEINDIEMAIDDLKVYLWRLSNIPRKPMSK